MDNKKIKVFSGFDIVFSLVNYSREITPLVREWSIPAHPLNIGRKKKGRRSKW